MDLSSCSNSFLLLEFIWPRTYLVIRIWLCSSDYFVIRIYPTIPFTEIHFLFFPLPHQILATTAADPEATHNGQASAGQFDGQINSGLDRIHEFEPGVVNAEGARLKADAELLELLRETAATERHSHYHNRCKLSDRCSCFHKNFFLQELPDSGSLYLCWGLGLVSSFAQVRFSLSIRPVSLSIRSSQVSLSILLSQVSLLIRVRLASLLIRV